MKIRAKRAVKIILCVLIIFLVINSCWYTWRFLKYSRYSGGMEKNPFYTWLVPRYKWTDADRFDYGVKYPEYLSFTGNLSVGMPTVGEDPFSDFLIIWPKFFGGYEYGVSLSYGDLAYQIEINEDGTAVDPQYAELAERCRETIDILLARADEMWHITEKAAG
jgi:hypothetical protein